ncbi:MAG: nucleoside-diphosphate kinase [Candidatus Parcubacteria bacterium]|nr:nucleoside-diphosphate kinase [Candidatus Parcubacteria bacterium]
MEKTLVIIKPDGVQRNLIGEITSRFERSGLKLVATKLLRADDKMVEKHYTIDPEWVKKVGLKAIGSYKEKGLTPPNDDPIAVGKDVLKRLKDFMTAGPVLAMVWEGNEAVSLVRKICGSTEPFSAAIGTIRGDYNPIETYQMADLANRAIRNLVHASGTPDEAEKEITIWFKKEEILDYNLARDTILYDYTWKI